MDLSGWQRFTELTAEQQTPEAVQAWLELFLTAEERAAVTDRLLIVQALLCSDKPQRQIAKELGVSIAKITRGSNYLKTLSDEQVASLKEILS